MNFRLVDDAKLSAFSGTLTIPARLAAVVVV
jgi:hypothetical protein